MMCPSRCTDSRVCPCLFYYLPMWPTSQPVNRLDWFQLLFLPSVTNADVACDYSSYPIYPFAFRTHTHRLGESQRGRSDSASPSQRTICNGRCSLAQVKSSVATESATGSGAWLGDSPPSCHRYAKNPLKDFDSCRQHSALCAAIHGITSALSEASTAHMLYYAFQSDFKNDPELKTADSWLMAYLTTHALIFFSRLSTLQPKAWLLDMETPWQPDVSSLVKA